MSNPATEAQPEPSERGEPAVNDRLGEEEPTGAAAAPNQEGATEAAKEDGAAEVPNPVGAAEATSPDGATEAAVPDDVAAAAAATANAEAGPGAANAASSAPTLSPAQCAAELAQRFPALFGTDGPPKPLKLRIQADIQQRAPGVFTRKALSPFLHRHTTSTPYLKALVASADRFDLDGQPAGTVADEHRQAAQVELERRRALVAARRAAMAPGGPRGPAAGGDRQTAGGAPDARGPRGNRPTRPGQRAQGHDRSAAGMGTGTGQRPRDGHGGHHGHPGGAGPAQAPGPRGHRPERRRDEDAPAAADGATQQRPARRPERPQRPQRPERPERFERSAQSARTDRPHRAQAPQRPTRPDAPVDDQQPRQEADPARRERATLLRQWESSPLTKANFCVLKRLSEADLDAALALARQERGAASPASP